MNRTFIPLYIFSLMLISPFAGAGLPSSDSQPPLSSMLPDMLVRVDLTKQTVILPRDVEILSMKPGEYVDIIIPTYRIQELSRITTDYTVLVEDVESYSNQFLGQYHTLAQIEQILADTAANYPAITQLTSIGTTYEGRSILCLEISDNPGTAEGEPGVLFMGLHHAREWPTVEICLNIISQLTSQYGSDPTITSLVNNRRVWIVPCSNPDGYYYCHDQGHDWRKNRQYFPETSSIGVDLNRNYGGSMDGEPFGEWGSVHQGAATHQPQSEVYCGPSGFSENETQAIRNMFLTHDISASISWHTYSELVLWPWGYSNTAHAPDNVYLKQIGQAIASRITQQDGSGTYTPEQASALYPTTGDTDDWVYGNAYYVQGTNTFSYTIEACQSFQPSASKLDQIVAENYDGAVYLLQEAENISHLIPRALPPAIDPLTNDPDGNYVVSWQEQNPAANVDVFQLDELSRLAMLNDDVESTNSLWTLKGFVVSTDEAHSGAQSYMGKNINNYASAMTSLYPLPVTTGMTLSFWCSYDTENHYDYGFVEVSRDGRKYDILDMYTGSSSGWVQKTYDLSAYAGSSLFIRFRYATDEQSLGDGFYVDDITPVPLFNQVTTVSDAITTHSYEVTGKADGTYYYQVKAHNAAHEWGDFSCLEKIVVGSGDDTQPPIVSIMTPAEKQLYLRNRVIPFFASVVIGSITVQADATDASGIERVEFYLDGALMGTSTQAPYTWLWNQTSFGKNTLKVVAVDTYENAASQEHVVWKFF
jgi:carboxypeptidase T